MFETIDIGIKTFLRDSCLFNAIEGIRTNFPVARMIIVDDGDQTEEKDSIYGDLHRAGHITDVMPFDSGFGAKSNQIAFLSSRPYLLIGSDDFEFDKKAAEGLFELQWILDNEPGIDIASGRVNNRHYEFDMHIIESSEGISIKEEPIRLFEGGVYIQYFEADLTVNYSLIRNEVFWKPLHWEGYDRAAERTAIGWDNDVKIGGGEHGAFFYDCKKAELKTVCAPGVNINEQQVRNSNRYKQYRNRAQSPERPCFDRRNIISYTLGNGRVDYRRQ